MATDDNRFFEESGGTDPSVNGVANEEPASAETSSSTRERAEPTPAPPPGRGALFRVEPWTMSVFALPKVFGSRFG